MLRYEHGGNIDGDAGIWLDVSANINPLGMPKAAREALLAQMDTFSRYPDPHCRALGEALGAHHNVGPDWVLCGNGAAELIFRLCACLRPGRALTLAPTFSEYERTVRLFGGDMVVHSLGEGEDFALTEGMLSALIPDIEIVFLCNPNNPTGRLAPFDLLYTLAEACAKNGTLLVVDECFLDFTEGQSMAPLLGKFPNLLILKAFTKFYGLAGLRLGYLLGEPTLLSRLAPFGPMWSVSGAAQAAGLGALKEPGWAQRTGALIQAERGFLAAGLSALGLTLVPSEANFILLKSQRPLYAPLKGRGILVRDCSNFMGLGPAYIRVGLKTREENQALLRAVQEVLYG